jgi:hypothetical protein
LLKPEEEAKSRVFFDQVIADLNCVIPEAHYDEIVWHYTTGESLIEIIRTGSLFATQVACLNDTTELRYAVSHSGRNLKSCCLNLPFPPEN